MTEKYNNNNNNNNNSFTVLHFHFYTSVAVLISVQLAISHVDYTVGRVLDQKIVYRNSKPSHNHNNGTACNDASTSYPFQRSISRIEPNQTT